MQKTISLVPATPHDFAAPVVGLNPAIDTDVVVYPVWNVIKSVGGDAASPTSAWHIHPFGAVGKFIEPAAAAPLPIEIISAIVPLYPSIDGLVPNPVKVGAVLLASKILFNWRVVKALNLSVDN